VWHGCVRKHVCVEGVWHGCVVIVWVCVGCVAWFCMDGWMDAYL